LNHVLFYPIIILLLIILFSYILYYVLFYNIVYYIILYVCFTELDEKDEKIQMLYKQIEVKSMEAQKFKTAAEVAKVTIIEVISTCDTLI